MTTTPKSKRRRHTHRRALPSGIQQPPWQSVRNPYPPAEILSQDALEDIHRASLTILEQIGIEILLPEAAEYFRRAGAHVTGTPARVTFEPELIEALVAQAPSQITLHARNPEHHVRLGGDHVAFGLVASAPNVTDIDKGRRTGNRHDFCQLLKLGQTFNIIHVLGGYPVEPVDLPPSTRHLDAISDMLLLTDKAIHAYSLGRERILDGMEMARIARGIDHATFDREPSLLTVINANSPLRYDRPMLWGIIEMAKRNQLVVVTPFTLAGAMSPITVAGSLAQQNAEALAGIALCQIVRPGSPVMYGGFTSNADMRSGAPAFGTPEYLKAAQISGQLARRYGIPYRSSNVNAANSVDAQAAYESMFSLWGAVSGKAHLIKHGAGWLEGGLSASYEKVVLDADLLQMVAAYLEPIRTDSESLALDAIREVGPGGHFFGTAHTQERFENAFYQPMISDWRNFESWQEAGSPSALQRANALSKTALTQYTQPPMDSAIREELADYVARRKAQGGVRD
jgi:trimethylamine--corrinoid protein Co-methyltransferase